MQRKYYLLPAEFCKSAIEQYKEVKARALSAKTLIHKKYGCDGVMRQGHIGKGIVFKKPLDVMQKFGFCEPQTIDGGFLYIPKKSSNIGRECHEMLSDYAELAENWQWALERALGVHGCVFNRLSGFHYLIARPLKDGTVLLNSPAEKNAPITANSSRNFNDPVIPNEAVEISKEEFDALMLNTID